MSAGIVFFCEFRFTTQNSQKVQHRNPKIILPNRDDPLDEKKTPSYDSVSTNERHDVKNIMFSDI